MLAAKLLPNNSSSVEAGSFKVKGEEHKHIHYFSRQKS